MKLPHRASGDLLELLERVGVSRLSHGEACTVVLRPNLEKGQSKRKEGKGGGQRRAACVWGLYNCQDTARSPLTGQCSDQTLFVSQEEGKAHGPAPFAGIAGIVARKAVKTEAVLSYRYRLFAHFLPFVHNTFTPPAHHVRPYKPPQAALAQGQKGLAQECRRHRSHHRPRQPARRSHPRVSCHATTANSKSSPDSKQRCDCRKAFR